MTVAALAPSIEYVENGVTLAFAAPFRFFAPTDLLVQRIDASGNVTTLAYGTAYSVSGGSTDSGGTVTVAAAAIAGTRLRIRRATPRGQTTDYTTGDTFPAETHEATADRAMLIDQEQDIKIADVEARAFVLPAGDTQAALPKAADRAGKWLGFDGLGARVLASAAVLAATLAPFLPANLKGDPGGYFGDVGAVGAIPSVSIPSGVSQFWTTDGGRWIEDATVTDSDVAAHPLAIRKTSNGRYFRRAPDYLNVEQFGADPTGVADSYPAITSALAYWKWIGAKRGDTLYYSGGTLWFNGGTYRVSETIKLKQRIRLRGWSTGRENENGTAAPTRLKFPPSITGIIVNRDNTLNESGTVGNSGSAQDSIIEGIELSGGGGTHSGDFEASGIVVRARCEIRYCIANYFGAYGFAVLANEDGAYVGNANETQIYNCTTNHNGEDGVINTGNNNNANFCHGLMSGYNGGYGFRNGHITFGGPVNVGLSGGHMVSNGKLGMGLGQTSTSVSWLNNRIYGVVPGQAPGASTNSPSGDNTDNAYWYCIETGATGGPFSDIPLWHSGISTREGGAAFFAGVGASWLSPYTEGRQGPIFCGGGTAFLGGVHGAGRRGTFTG